MGERYDCARWVRFRLLTAYQLVTLQLLFKACVRSKSGLVVMSCELVASLALLCSRVWPERADDWNRRLADSIVRARSDPEGGSRTQLHCTSVSGSRSHPPASVNRFRSDRRLS